MEIKSVLAGLVFQVEVRYQQANRASRGLLGVLRQTVERLGSTRVSQSSASIAYYALFSLFPLLLFLSALASFFVNAQAAQDQVLGLAGQVLPESQAIQDLLSSTIKAVFARRGEIGIIAAIGLLWSASAAFSTLAYNIDLAWAIERPVRPPFLQRLVGIAMVLILGASLVLVLVISPTLRVLQRLDHPLLQSLGIDGSTLAALATVGISWLLTFIVLLILYKVVPGTLVRWRVAALTALAATAAWQILSAGFSWFLTSGLNRYQFIYGSVATVVVLMLWIYLSMLVVLVGAHLGAALARREDLLAEPQSEDPA